jgi:hypothetical protein
VRAGPGLPEFARADKDLRIAAEHAVVRTPLMRRGGDVRSALCGAAMAFAVNANNSEGNHQNTMTGRNSHMPPADIAARHRIAIPLVCRDLAVIGHAGAHVAVMRQGAIVERLSGDDLVARRIAHAYTKRLLAACDRTLAIS